MHDAEVLVAAMLKKAVNCRQIEHSIITKFISLWNEIHKHFLTCQESESGSLHYFMAFSSIARLILLCKLRSKSHDSMQVQIAPSVIDSTVANRLLKFASSLVS